MKGPEGAGEAEEKQKKFKLSRILKRQAGPGVYVHVVWTIKRLAIRNYSYVRAFSSFSSRSSASWSFFYFFIIIILKQRTTVRGTQTVTLKTNKQTNKQTKPKG